MDRQTQEQVAAEVEFDLTTEVADQEDLAAAEKVVEIMVLQEMLQTIQVVAVVEDLMLHKLEVLEDLVL
jgi:hypothetical protein